ncbi:MAG: TIGR03435 family protein [Acidobacteriota bacterium]
MRLFTLFAVAATVLWAQARPEFDVATVRLAPQDIRESYLPTLDLQPGATLRITGRRLDEIIMLAYDVGVKQLSGPNWLLEPTTDPSIVTRFDIQAKIPANAKKDDIPLMLQRLLEERFKLKVHRESKVTQVYALEVAKGRAQAEDGGADGSGIGLQASGATGRELHGVG